MTEVTEEPEWLCWTGWERYPWTGRRERQGKASMQNRSQWRCYQMDKQKGCSHSFTWFKNIRFKGVCELFEIKWSLCYNSGFVSRPSPLIRCHDCTIVTLWTRVPIRRHYRPNHFSLISFSDIQSSITFIFFHSLVQLPDSCKHVTGSNQLQYLNLIIWRWKTDLAEHYMGFCAIVQYHKVG